MDFLTQYANCVFTLIHSRLQLTHASYGNSLSVAGSVTNFRFTEVNQRNHVVQGHFKMSVALLPITCETVIGPKSVAASNARADSSTAK